jgi:tetratricopeptide (TPR) repeat protein
MSQVSRFLIGTLVLLILGCTAIKKADKRFQSWTDEMLRGRDPDTRKKTTAKASKPSEKKKALTADAGVSEPAEPAVVAEGEPAETGAAASAAAETLFDKGHEAMKAGDYKTACERFRESDRLEPAVGAKLNLANCEQQRGRYATSSQIFKLVLSQLPSNDDRVPIARERVKDLQQKIPTITFELVPGEYSDVTVKEGELVLRAASFGVPLEFDPGDHQFIVEAPGRKWRRYKVALEAAERRVLKVHPGAKL